jgi:hypothetical protein
MSPNDIPFDFGTWRRPASIAIFVAASSDSGGPLPPGVHIGLLPQRCRVRAVLDLVALRVFRLIKDNSVSFVRQGDANNERKSGGNEDAHRFNETQDQRPRPGARVAAS